MPPPARALVVFRTWGGGQLFINEPEMAKHFLALVAPARGHGFTDVGNRAEVCVSALEAHRALNVLTGEPHHNLGVATSRAGSLLTRSETKALRSLRRKSNSARHNWAEAPDVDSLAADASDPGRYDSCVDEHPESAAGPSDASRDGQPCGAARGADGGGRRRRRPAGSGTSTAGADAGNPPQRRMNAKGALPIQAVNMIDCLSQPQSDGVYGHRHFIPDGSVGKSKCALKAGAKRKEGRETTAGVHLLKGMAAQGNLLIPAAGMNDCAAKSQSGTADGYRHSLHDNFMRDSSYKAFAERAVQFEELHGRWPTEEELEGLAH